MSAVRHAYSHLIRVKPDEIDELQHVNNAVYVQYFEACVRAHAAAIGAPLPYLLEQGLVPLARRHTISYHRPAIAGDELLVSTVITHSRGVRATRHNEVRRAGSGELLVEMDSDWVWVDVRRGRPKAPTHALLEAFGVASEPFV